MRVEFPTTMWSNIAVAADGSVRAMNRFAGVYRPVVGRLAAAKGFAPADADDLAQEVLLALCDASFLAGADRNKGRFRDLVFSVVRNKMREAWRRRARRKEAPLADAQDPADAPKLEDDYNRLWRQQLVQLAMERLGQAQAAEPHPPYHTVLKRHRLDGVPLADVARELSTDVVNVKNWLKRGKQRLAGFIREVVCSYSSSREEFKDDLALFTGGAGE